MDGTDTVGNQTDAGSATSTAGNWMQAAGQTGNGQQTDQAQQALTKMQHPNPETQPQTTTPTTKQGVSGGVPLVLRPKRGGLLGVVDKIADVLGGTTRPEIYTDQDGNEFVYHPNLSRGQQWARIGAELGRGAASGFAAGRGAGGEGRAALAGFQEADRNKQEGQQQEQQMEDKAQRDMLNKANATMLRMQIIEQAWKASRLQTVANQQDAEFSQKRLEFLTSPSQGGVVLGTAAHPGDLAEILKISPELAKDFVQRHIIEPINTVDQDGHKGVTFVKMPNADWRKQLIAPGEPVHFFNPATHQVEEQKASDGMTRGDQFDLDSKAYGDQLTYNNNQKEQELKGAQIKNVQGEEEARRKKLPGEIEETAAKAAEAMANAKKANLESGANEDLVDAIGTGHVTPERMSYLLTRNPGLVAEVTKKYPDFDSTKAGAYHDLYKDFISGKVSVQLNGGDAALKHLQELRALNTAMSHVPHTPAWTKYQNKVDTVSTELARFYGDETIPGIASIKNTLASTLPGNREAAIQTQLKSMGDKLDSFENQWKKGAPSAAYEAPMPGISLEAKEARAALDPEYADRLTIKMRAPNGDIAPVPYKMVKEAQQKGATVIEQ